MTKTKGAASLSIANYGRCTVLFFQAVCTVHCAWCIFFQAVCSVQFFKAVCIVHFFQAGCSVQCVVLSGFLTD